MTSTSSLMAHSQHVLLSILWNTSPNNLIWTKLIQIWIIPSIVFCSWKKILFHLHVPFWGKLFSCQVVDYICKPRQLLHCTKCIIKKLIISLCFLKMWLYFNLGEMINNQILYPLLILDLHVKFLKKNDPYDKPCFDILFIEYIFQGWIIGKSYYWSSRKVVLEFIKCEHHCKELIFSRMVFHPLPDLVRLSLHSG